VSVALSASFNLGKCLLLCVFCSGDLLWGISLRWGECKSNAAAYFALGRVRDNACGLLCSGVVVILFCSGDVMRAAYLALGRNTNTLGRRRKIK